MSTTAPIDVEKYLLQGEGEEGLDIRKYLQPIPSRTQTTSVKPSLEDALLQSYNSTSEKKLAPGELPAPTLAPEPPPSKRLTLPGLPNVQLDLSTQNRTGREDYINLGGQPTTDTVSIPDSRLYTSKRDLHQQRLADLSSKSRGLIGDLGEAAYTITRDVVGGAFGAATAVSDILNAQLARIAKHGPLAGGPESPTHYRDIFKEMNKTISDVRYEPQSDIARNAHKAVGGVAGLVSDLSELVTKPIAYITGLDEDRSKVLSFAIELYAFYKLDAGVRRAAPAIRSKMSEFADRMSKMKSDGDYTASGAERAAQDLYTVVNRNPEAVRAITEARQKLIGEAGKPGGEPTGPPPEGGPAPGGARVDPADLQAYKDTLRERADTLRKQGAGPTRIQNELNAIPKPQPRQSAEQARYQDALNRATDEFARAHPEGFTNEQLQAELNKVPKPGEPIIQEGTFREPLERGDIPIDPETLNAELIRYRRELAARRAEFVAAHPEGYTERQLNDYLARVARPVGMPRPTLATERPSAPETVAGQETALAPRVSEAPRSAVESIRPSTEQVREAVLQPRPIEAPIIAPQAQETEAAATVAPETVPAPVSPETPAVAAVASTMPSVVQSASPARNLYDAANAPDVGPSERTSNLAQLKTLAREGLRSNEPTRVGLERLGFTPDEVSTLEQQLRKVRAKKAGTETLQQIAETPSVQTAATEAVLDTAPAGTEVEIPAPDDSVINSTPVVEKPKRKRRIVKAKELELPELGELAQAELRAPIPRTTALPAGNYTYTIIDSVPNLQTSVRGETSLVPGGVEPSVVPLQVRSTEGKPNAIFVDTARLNTRTPLTDIQAQTQRGRMSTEVSSIMQANLARQAQLFGVPLGAAHTTTGEELQREATRIAAENDLDLYVKKGKNYELVPKDVVRTDARLNAGDDLRPVTITPDAAGAYAESKTSPIGPDMIREIQDAIETGRDISDKLPAELLPHYREMLENERLGIDTSERRSFLDMLIDFNTMLGEQGKIGGEFTREMRMATQRLQADFRKIGKSAKEFFVGARPEDVAVFENYLNRINNPAPPDSTNPRNMRFDPTIPKSRGDRVVKQRVISKELGLDAPPLWQSEVTAIQNANDIKPGGGVMSLKTPYWQHKKAGTEFLYYSYRTAQKNVDASLNDLHKDMQELSRGFSVQSLENIGAIGYQRQGPDGQRLLTFNKVKVKPLTPAEERLRATIDEIYADTLAKVNDTRIASGKEPITGIDSYQTFARTFTLLERLNMAPNLITDDASHIMNSYNKHKGATFPYAIKRKGAFYSAEMNALKVLDTYMQTALKQIYLGPFIAKMHELVDTNLPDPVTGKETWSLKNEKPGLYQELTRWYNYLATGSNLELPANARYWLNTANRNLGYAMLSYGLRSGAVQLSTLRNTSQSLGWPATFNGVVSHITDIVSGGKQWDFALKNSEVLSSRKFVDAYNSVAGALAGRNIRDLTYALTHGRIGELQQVVGGVGMKFLELPDMQAALMSWNAAYKQATNKLGYNHKDAVRFADDLVVRTQGSTMPGDLAGIQRNALGKAVTQFQTFAISDWNFLTNEVFSKSKGGSRSSMFVNILKFVFATQLMNELFRLMHIQSPFPELVRDFGTSAMKGFANLIEPIPMLSSTRYGRGMGGPLLETARDLSRAIREDPMAPNPLEPAAALVGIPGTRQISKTTRALNRGESFYDSMLGWYSEERSSGGRERGERSSRRTR